MKKTEAGALKQSDVVPTNKPEFVLKRAFDAPRQLVYKIWTDPRYVKQWWGVDGSTIVLCELDVRPGGKYRIDMKTKDGTVYVNRGSYLEVVANERIVTRDERDAGSATGNFPAAVHTVTFADVDGGTAVTLTSRFETIEDRDLMVNYGTPEGISQSLKRLEQLITAIVQEGKQS
jgi:uncharacterized protein YndB with AHSA1/START domain